MAHLCRTPDQLQLHLLYFRPGSEACTALDEQVFDFAARHRSEVRLVVRHSYEPGPFLDGWVGDRAPTLLFVRGAHVVGHLVGESSAPELESLFCSLLRAAAA